MKKSLLVTAAALTLGTVVAPLSASAVENRIPGYGKMTKEQEDKELAELVSYLKSETAELKKAQE